MEEVVTVDTDEMVKFISDGFNQMNITIADKVILNVLDLEVEFLKSKGVIE